ncbi:hypothetical protein [Aeromonas caviae]|uniref:hypothetical protein n=1 Tax=Aeromonas caviae TaxID=648 RepID=UPI002B47A97B|nr:hypothetical protein [Aeromonas caviae]
MTGGYFTVNHPIQPFSIFENIESKCRKPSYLIKLNAANPDIHQNKDLISPAEGKDGPSGSLWRDSF